MLLCAKSGATNDSPGAGAPPLGERMPLTRCSAPLMLWRRLMLRRSPLVFSASAPDASLDDTCQHLPSHTMLASLQHGGSVRWHSL